MTVPATPPLPSPGVPEASAPERPAGPQGQPIIPASALPPVDPTNPLAVALDQARRSGQKVEIVSAQTETLTTWANPDGTLTSAVSSGPIRVKQGDKFVPVDPTLVASRGVIAPKAARGSIKISAGGAAGSELASISSADSRLALRWPAALPAPTLSGDAATYHDVAPGQDLVVRATTTGSRPSSAWSPDRATPAPRRSTTTRRRATPRLRIR